MSVVPLALVLAVGCSSSSGGGTDERGGSGGGAAGSGGSGSGGIGSGGIGSGGGGSGGAADAGTGSGGAGGGGSGGSAGTGGGGGGSGGSGSGGAGGSGTDAGSDARLDSGGSDARLDSGADVATDVPSNDGATGGPSLDACFAGLRAGSGFFQDATKSSVDGRYQVRLALETADRSGTSGTSPWTAFAVALKVPGASVCVAPPAAFTGTYRTSLHNCADTLSVTSGGRRYEIRNPDSALNLVDMTSYSRDATLTIFEGTTMVEGPIILKTTTCHRASPQTGKCRSGGPCT